MPKKNVFSDALTWLFIALPAFVPLAPYVVLNAGFASITIARLCVLLALGFFIGSALTRGKISVARGEGRVVALLIVLFGVLMALSTFWADHSDSSIVYVIQYSTFAILILIALCAPLREDYLSKAVPFWIFGAAYETVFALFESIFQFRLLTSRYYFEPAKFGFPPTGTFYNENNLAIYLAISCIFFFAYIGKKGKLMDLVMLSLIGIAAYIIMETESRGALVFLASGLVGMMFLNLRSAKINGAIGFMVMFSVVLLAYWIYQGQVSTNQIEASVGSLGFEAGGARIILIKLAFQAMQANFFLGVGAGNLEIFVRESGFVVLNAHNWLAEVAGNGGLIGFLIWLSVYVLLFYHLVFVRIANKQLEPAQKALMVIVVCIPLWQSILSSVAQFPPFWILMIMMIYELSNKWKAKHVAQNASVKPVAGFGALHRP